MKKVIALVILLAIAGGVYWYFFTDNREINILVFSKTESFRHESIPAGIQAIQSMGNELGWRVDTTENSARFNETDLQNYNVIIFLNTTGDVLDEAQQLEMNRWIQAGGGFVGIHAAADTEYDWPWYNELVGAWFESHPNNPNVFEATIQRLDSTHISTAHLPSTWTREDEWYNYKSIRPTINVLLNLDETSYEGGTNGANHPIAWYQEFDGGRVFYTGLGHTDETYEEPLFLDHLKGGIEYAAGPGVPVDYNNANVAPEENRFRKIVLDFNLNEPMELDVLPNGDLLFVERHGDIKMFKEGASNTTVVATLEVFDDLEDGLLGLAVDPNYAENNWIYLYYSLPGDLHVQNLSRFNLVDGSLDRDSEKVLLQVPTQRDECCHSAGSIEFGPEGDLYLSIGDNTSPRATAYSPIDEQEGQSAWDAQKSSSNTHDLRGKILRITPQPDGTYTIPDGNLFPKDGSKGRPEIYVMGNRNPFRISIDQRTGYLYWGEVGPDAGKDSTNRGPRGYDEVNQAKSAGNFGWPYFIGDNYAYVDYDFATKASGKAFNKDAPENNSPNNTGEKMLPPAQPAFIWYPYGESTEFPLVGTGARNAMAGPVYYFDDYPDNDIKFPKYYDGKLFIYDWMRKWIIAVTMDENGALKRMERFLPSLDLSNPMDMVFTSTGEMFMLEYGTNWFTQNIDARLIQIEYNASNRQPVANIVLNQSIGGIPMNLEISGLESVDYDGDELAYAWYLGEELIGESPTLSHTLNEAGEYQLRLIVTDPEGQKGEAETRIIAGNDLPEIAWNFSGNTQFYFSDSYLDYNITVTDKEDGSLGNGIDPSEVFVNVDYLPQGFDMVGATMGHEALQERSTFIVGKALIETSDCKSCHQVDQKSIGPTYREIATKYQKPEDVEGLAKKIIDGGGGVWGDAPMAAHPQLSLQEATQMVKYIQSLAGSSLQTGLPLQGRIQLDQHGDEKTGTYVLSATYTDKGANNLEPLTQRNLKTLKYPLLLAKDFTEGENTMTFDVKAEDVPGFDEDVTILVGMDQTKVAYADIDFTGMSKILVHAAVIPQVTAGGQLFFRIDTPDGDILAELTVETSITELGVRELEIPLNNLTGIHTLHMQVLSVDEGAPFGAIIDFEFK